MRCPKCRKKVHNDDIYCIWCSASLRGRSPDDPWNCICADDETHKTHRPRKQPSRKSGRKILFAIFLALMLGLLPTVTAAIFFTVEALVDEFHTLMVAPEPEPEISFLIRTEDAQYNTTATGEALICLNPGDNSGTIRSQWE